MRCARACASCKTRDHRVRRLQLAIWQGRGTTPGHPHHGRIKLDSCWGRRPVSGLSRATRIVRTKDSGRVNKRACSRHSLPITGACGRVRVPTIAVMDERVASNRRRWDEMTDLHVVTYRIDERDAVGEFPLKPFEQA